MLKKTKKTNAQNNPKRVNQKFEVIGVWKMFSKSWIEISSFWRPLLGIIIVYAILNIIFIAGISLLPSDEAIKTQIEDLLGTEAGRFVSSMTLVSLSFMDVTSPANTIMQLALFLVASMAFVWALRKLRGLKKFKIRQAYYEGPSNIIAMILVVSLFMLMLIPATLAAIVLNFGVTIAGSNLEITLIYLFSGFLTYLSVYWIAVWWPAFYIIMLPGTTPIKALQAAAEITKYNRLKLFGRHFVILATLVVLFLSVVIPVSLIWQRIIPLTVYVTIFILFGIMHVMLFTLYRNLVDGRKP